MAAYNVERGLQWERQIELFLREPGMPRPDLLLLNEADRGCSRTAYMNIAREYARALRMCYVFGVEFLELPRLFGAGRRIRSRCEHGNAILSRYPLGNVQVLRFPSNRSWLWHGLSPLFGEPRLGGRMALRADVKVGESYLRVYAAHLESGRGDERLRGEQAGELVRDAVGSPLPVLIGGDINCGTYFADLRYGATGDAATQALFRHGYADAHADLPLAARMTTASGVVVDLILGRGIRFSAAGVGPRAGWSGLSDHLPVWATVQMDATAGPGQ